MHTFCPNQWSLDTDVGWHSGHRVCTVGSVLKDTEKDIFLNQGVYPGLLTVHTMHGINVDCRLVGILHN